MSNALATVQYKPTDLDTNTLGQIMVKSGFFKDTKDEAQAIVKILYGREIGFGPITSMMNVYIVDGRPSLSAQIMAAAIQKSKRYHYRVRTWTATECRIAFFDGSESLGESSFSMAEAATAKLSTKDNWVKYPKSMLWARAMSLGARAYCSEVFGGVIYTPDELGAEVNDEGHVIEVTSSEPAPQTTDVDEETGEMPDDDRTAALKGWVIASDEATKLGIEHKQLEADMTPERIGKWTDALTAKILKAQGAAA
jgi:hypothetical protein